MPAQPDYSCTHRGRRYKAGGAQNALRNSFAPQAPTEYIIRVRPIVGSRRGCRTLWFSRVRVLLRCVTLCGAITDAEISTSSSSVVTNGASRQIILGDVPHSFRMPFFQQKKMRNTRNPRTCLVVT